MITPGIRPVWLSRGYDCCQLSTSEELLSDSQNFPQAKTSGDSLHLNCISLQFTSRVLIIVGEKFSGSSSSLTFTNIAISSVFCVLVDDLFKEANIKSNGVVNYEEFTQMVMLPPVDY